MSLSYKVYHSTADITLSTDLTALTETEVTSGTTAALSSLTGGTPYYLIVIANNGYGDSTRPAAITDVPWEADRAPGEPTSVTIDSSTETGIDLSWTPPTDTGIEGGSGTQGVIIGYEVYYSKTAGFTIGGGAASTSTNTNSISLSSLDSGTRYYFKVTAANAAGSGSASAEADGYTTGRPGAPTAVAADPGTTADNEVTLTWDAPVDTGIAASGGKPGSITEYKVYYATSAINDLTAAGVESETSTGTGTSMTITGLTAGTRYYFKVTAVSAIGEGTASAEVNTYTNSLPGVPTNIQANSKSVGEITVTWDAPSPGYYDGSEASVSYKVYHKIDNLAKADLPSLTPATVDTDLSHVLTGLQAGITYYVTVIAVNDFGDSAMPTSVEADRAPGEPTSVIITSSTETGIELSWTAPGDTGIEGGSGAKGTIMGYEVYYSKTANFTIDAGTASTSTNTNGISFTTLDSGTRYYFKVTAANDSGSGNPSAEIGGYTTSRPGAPTDVAADPGTTANNEVTLTWDAPGDTGIADSGGKPGSITEYKVYYAASTINDLNAAVEWPQSATGTSMTITGLSAGNRYYFKVTAVNGIGEGTTSSEADTYTNSLPGVPSNIQATQGIESLTVSWTAPSAGFSRGSSGVLSYKVYHSTADITSGTDLTALTETDASSGTTAALSSLTGGTPYYLIVIANNGFGDSTRPAAITAVPWEPNRVPGAPTSVKITSSTETGMTLSWTAPGDKGIINDNGTQGTISAYTIYYSKTQNFTIDGQTAKRDVGSITTASIDNLNSKTQYYFKVTAANATGSGNASTEGYGYTTGRPGAPTDVAADPGTTADNEVTLTWDVPDDTGIADSGGTAGTITGYKVYYAASTINDLNAAGVESETSTGTGTSKTITGLTAGTRYYFKVTAVSAIGEGTASAEANTYTNSLPGVPTNIQANSTGVGEITVTWDAPSPGYYDGSAASVSYKVYHKIDNLAEADLLSLTPATVDTDLSHVLTGLQAGITYYVTVIAVNDFGDSAMPTSVEADRTPGEPTSVTITLSTETGIELSWTAPGDTGIEGGSGAKGRIMGYEVYYSKTANFAIDDQGVKSQTLGNTTSISLSSLDSGTRYYFKVTAANAAGSGNPSAEIGGYTTSRPGAPTAVAANPGTTADNEVTLTWDAPDDTGIADSGGKPGSITEYKVYYAASTINDLNAAVEWPQSATGTSMTITGLSAGNRYYFKVTAVNGIGEGTTSSEADTYTNSLPGVPSNIQAAQGVESLTVSWTAPSAGYAKGGSGVLSYKLYHSTAVITPDTDLTALTKTEVTSGTTATLSSLTGGTPYYLIVIANNGYGDGSRPTVISAVPWEPNRGPGAPTSVKITSSTETGIELSWTAPGDTGIEGGSGAKGRIMGYEVYYSKTANFAIDDQGVKSQTLGNTTSISLSSLDSGTRYYFKVTAANDSGSGNPSEEADGYTTSRPGAPTDVAANPGTTANNEVTLTWDAPGDTGIKDSTGMADTIIGYRVYHAASPITDVGGVTGVNAQGESHKITGLTPGTRYYFKVTAVSAIGEGTASAEVNTYTNSLPGVPTSIQANSTGVGEITVTWDAPSPGYYDGSAASVSYKVYHKIDNLAEADLLSLTPATVDTGRSHVLTGLQGGSTYFVTVIAVNDFGDSAMPTSVEANRPPGAPTSVNITSSTETGIKLSWIPPTDVGIINGDGTQGTILGYEVHYSKTPNFAIDDQGVKSQTLGDAISFSLSSLESGTRYYLRVTAANESGSGAASAEADGYTTSRPDAPTNVSPLPVTDTDATEIEVTWEAPVGTGIKDIGGTADNITGYRLYYAASPITDANGAGVTGVDVQGTSKKITSGLAVGTQYYFKVTAVNGTGEGTASDVSTYTDGPPGQPENVAASPNGIWGTSATVRWAHPTNSGYYGGQPLAHPAKYRVYWAESTGTIERDRGNYTDVGGDQTSLVIGGDHSDNDVPHAGSLMPDTEYKFAVEAFSFDDSRSKRRSLRLNEDSFTPFQLAPDGPTNLRSIQADKEGRAVFLEWDPPAYTGRYNDGTEAPLEDISYTIAAMPVGAGVDSLSAAAEKGAASILISQAAGTLASDKDFVPGVEYGFQVTSRLEKEGIGDGRGSNYKSDTWQAPITLRAGSPVHTQSYIGGMTVDGAEQPRFGSSDGALAISPDGKSLYLVATEAETDDYFEGGTLLVFDRDEDGTITLREEHPHIQSMYNDDGLRRPRDVVVSPDGKNVYLVADGNTVYFFGEFDVGATLVVFSRDDDGSLTKTKVFRNNKGGVRGMADASALAISPGGETIYVAGPEDNSLAIFDRNTTTGALAYSNMVQSADDLTEVEDVAVSADGEKVYAVGPGSLAIFDRDSSGSLTSRGVLKQGVSGVGGLEEPTGVAVSSDGQNVYVSDNTDGVTTFRRNASGGLTYVETLPNADSRDLVVSPDGRYVYVPTNDEFEVYERDIDGSLTSDVNFGVTVPGANSCNAVVISPDNKNIYVFTNTSVLQDEHGTDIDAKGLLLTFLRFDIY